MFILEKLINIIAPNSCISCGSEGSILCDWCKPDALLPIPSRCYRCQAQTKDFLVCPKCRKVSKLRHVWVVTDYEGIAKDLIKSLKFGYKRESAEIIAGAMADTLPYISDDALIVPIETASIRVRQRGFDHAKLIAKSLASNQGFSYCPVLKRSGTSRQVGAKRQQRLQQLADAFWVSSPELIKGKHILLVDDVLTTGATLETAAQALRKTGATSVNAVVLGQAR
jgi:ComF family protein